MTTTKLSNYEALCLDWARRFLDMDPKLLFRGCRSLLRKARILRCVILGKNTELRKRQEKSSIWSRPRRRL